MNARTAILTIIIAPIVMVLLMVTVAVVAKVATLGEYTVEVDGQKYRSDGKPEYSRSGRIHFYNMGGDAMSLTGTKIIYYKAK